MKATLIYLRERTLTQKLIDMKKTLLAIAVLLLTSGMMLGQEKEKSYDEFSGHWLIGVQGGIGQTLGETRFGTLISPAAGRPERLAGQGRRGGRLHQRLQVQLPPGQRGRAG